jgi:hypothetical protein
MLSGLRPSNSLVVNMNKKKRAALHKHRKHIKKMKDRRKALALVTGQVVVPAKHISEEAVEESVQATKTKKPVVKKTKEQEERVVAPKKAVARVVRAKATDEPKKKPAKKSKVESAEAPKAAVAKKKLDKKKKSETESK